MIKWLDRGKWTRPTDKMAVYTEIESGRTWGIRVTLLVDHARVEAINGEKCTWYKPGPELSKEVGPPTLFERLRGITFDQKLREEVEAKRKTAALRELQTSGKGRVFGEGSNHGPSGGSNVGSKDGSMDGSHDASDDASKGEPK